MVQTDDESAAAAGWQSGRQQHDREGRWAGRQACTKSKSKSKSVSVSSQCCGGVNLRYRFGSSSINTSVIQVRSIDCG
jgi:hypothetical protein